MSKGVPWLILTAIPDILSEAQLSKKTNINNPVVIQVSMHILNISLWVSVCTIGSSRAWFFNQDLDFEGSFLDFILIQILLQMCIMRQEKRRFWVLRHIQKSQSGRVWACLNAVDICWYGKDFLICSWLVFFTVAKVHEDFAICKVLSERLCIVCPLSSQWKLREMFDFTRF